MVQQIALNPNASLEPHRSYTKPKVKDNRPAYIVSGHGFFDHNDKFRTNGSMFYYDFEPSLVAIQPLFANDKMNEFLAKLNHFGQEAAKQTVVGPDGKITRNKKHFTPYDLKEWNDSEELDLPVVEYLMGVPKTSDAKDEIR